MILLILLIIPTIVATGFYLFGGKRMTLGEYLMQNGIQAVILALTLVCSGIGSTWDTEVWNGRVTKKYSQHVSCSHSYSCHCYNVCTSTGKTTSCHQQCQTCYEHSYDVDWIVRTSNDESIEINRVNRQGTQEPPRFTQVQIGEATAVSHGYTNYIKASPESLFRKQGLVDKYEKLIPKYPNDIYDYYRLNRLVLVNGAVVSEADQWNRDLTELNSDLGKAKKVNIVVVVTKNLPSEFYFALEQSWIGSKQNDFVVVMNVDNAGAITWSEVMAFTQNKMAEVVVRDSVMKIGKLDRGAILAATRAGVAEHFIKRKMSDFEYLKNSTKPSKGMWVFSMILGLIVSVVCGIIFIRNDYNDSDERFNVFKQKKDEKMNNVVKVLLGFVGVLLIFVVIAASSVVSINNDLVSKEAGLTAQYKQNQNNYDSMTKKIIEMAQVPSMATSDLEKLTKAAISGRYGADGSKAVFQFIKEQNPTISTELYSKLQSAIEAGRNSFEAEQKMLLDKKRLYETELKSFPSNMVAAFLGFPKIDLAKIDIVTSDRTEKAFEDKKDEPIKLGK